MADSSNSSNGNNVGGRPGKEITREKLHVLQKQGFTAKEMASVLKCSTSLINNKLQCFGMQQRKKYSTITDAELDTITARLHDNHPNAGLKMMCGYIEAEGHILQRSRVKDSLLRVAGDRGGRKSIRRRQYKVASPNSLWHMDSHMKLIRWGISTHGCIDGYSRLIVFLQSSTNNKASTVFRSFLKATVQYGCPSRVRSDQGGENSHVALFMNLVNGISHHITGKSVHNQRIERLWFDVHSQVTSEFYRIFYELEDEGKLDINADDDIKALHATFLPEINQRLTVFTSGWNKHKVRTEGNKSPEQLWMLGMLEKEESNISAVNTVRNWDELSLHQQIHQALQRYNINANWSHELDEENAEDYISETRERFAEILSGNGTLQEKYCSLRDALGNIQDD